MSKGYQSSLFDWVDEGLLGNEDTVQEFSFILISDSADLGDLGAAEGEEGVVNTVKDELVLDILREGDSAAWIEVDEETLLSTKEVLDFDLLLVLGDDGVNWEMCMYQSHLISEAL
jgi:hypothetical protein